jgi:hypothetical protein
VTERETMTGMGTSGSSYIGSTAILRPGKRVLSEANVTVDPAGALADAWRIADARGGIPHVYAVAHDGQTLVVVSDVLITGRLAEEALGTGTGPT